MNVLLIVGGAVGEIVDVLGTVGGAGVGDIVGAVVAKQLVMLSEFVT
jgi:hypothetical protein